MTKLLIWCIQNSGVIKLIEGIEKRGETTKIMTKGREFLQIFKRNSKASAAAAHELTALTFDYSSSMKICKIAADKHVYYQRN